MAPYVNSSNIKQETHGAFFLVDANILCSKQPFAVQWIYGHCEYIAGLKLLNILPEDKHCTVLLPREEKFTRCVSNIYIVKQVYGEIKAKWHTISLFIIFLLVTNNIWVRLRPMATKVRDVVSIVKHARQCAQNMWMWSCGFLIYKKKS